MEMMPYSGMEMMNDEADWSDLSFDLLFQITDKVISSSLAEYIRFGCICVQWRSFFIENYEQIKLSNLPVLLIPSFNHHHHHSNIQKQEEGEVENNGDALVFQNYYDPKLIWLGLDHNQRHISTRNFYSLSERKVYDFQLQVPSYMNCRGSCHGWLVVVEESLDGTYPVHLLNPFRSSDKHNKIQLPPLNPPNHITSPAFHSFLLEKAIFNRNPSSSSSSLFQSNPTTNTDDFVVLGLYDNSRMGFCRPGDTVWTSLPNPEAIPYSNIVDVIFYKGQFWAIIQNGTAFAFDIAPESKVTMVVDPHPEDIPGPLKRYIVESAGDLFCVRRDFYFPDEDRYLTVGFHVFKLDQMTMKWVKTNTLDGRMFFLGHNTSISLSALDYIHESCKPNSIYFTDDYDEGYIYTPWIGPHDINQIPYTSQMIMMKVISIRHGLALMTLESSI